MRRRATRELLGEPKVSKYDVAIGSDKDILWLEVTIDNTRGVQTLDTLNDFCGIKAGTITAKATPACQLCRKITTRMEVLSRYKSAFTWDYWVCYARRTMTKNRFSLS
jgi:hypothetical protein